MQLVYNWHITEKCNFSCHFCFSNWKHPKEIWKDESTVNRILGQMATIPDDENLKLITNSVDSHPPRVNFVGGEPLLLGDKLIKYAKHARELGLSTSVITNASRLNGYIEIVSYLDIIGISIDSLCHQTNLEIGRNSRQGETLSDKSLSELILKIREINSTIKLKFNVVVNRYNYDEVIIPKLEQHLPDKIKVFRQLPFGKQKGISELQFQSFLSKNDVDQESIFVEDNLDMVNSYLMIDPRGRFFQNGSLDGYRYSEPIQKVGLQEALEGMGFESTKYLKRYKVGA